MKKDHKNKALSRKMSYEEMARIGRKDYDPVRENMDLLEGKPIHVEPKQDHEAHKIAHELALKYYAGEFRGVKKDLEAHIKEHDRYL